MHQSDHRRVRKSRTIFAVLAAVLAIPLVTTAEWAGGESLVANHLDADTHSMEGTTGRWARWYATAISRSTQRAAVGTASLRVDITGSNGWGVTLNNWPGFPAAPGNKVLRFSAFSGNGTPLAVAMRVKWRSSSKSDIRTDTVSIPALAANWQNAQASVVAPDGTAFVGVELVGKGGKVGDYLFVDDVVVGSLSAPTTTTSTTVSSTTTTVGSTTTTVSPGGTPIGLTEPPVRICGNASVLDGPSTPPPGAVTVPAGDNSGFFQNEKRAGATGKTYWFAPGTHTLGTSEFGQIEARPNSTYIGAPGAVLDGMRINRYAFTHAGATNVRVAHLTIQNFVAPRNEGTVNQGSGVAWTIEKNTVRNNRGGGIVLGTNNVMRQNCVTANGQLGFKMYRPQIPNDWAIKNVTVEQNEISYNNTEDWETQVPGCGCTGGGKFWDVNGALVTRNWVHHNKSVGLWADTNNANFTFSGNLIEDNDAEGIFYEISYNFSIVDNTLRRNGLVKGQRFAATNNGFPVGAIYISESGADPRVPGLSSPSEIRGNVLEDNWSGVVLWENANRFCNSTINASRGYCTRVNPSISHSTCVEGVINNEPYYSDCRWKTQNIRIAENHFRFNRAAVGCGTVPSCGKMGLFSNWGTTPDWSPYKGSVIQDRIVFTSANRWEGNIYTGDWKFTVWSVGRTVDFATWQTVYKQDGLSTKS